MRIIESSQDLQLAFDLFEDSVLSDLLLVQNLDRNLVAGLLVEGHFDLAEGTVTEVFRESVLSYSYFVL